MSFGSELSTLMNANTAINKLVNGIYRETSGTEFNTLKKWIIYTYKRNPNNAVVGDKDFLNMYSLYTEIWTSNAALTESINDALRTYLTSYASTTIRDITFISESHVNYQESAEDIAYTSLMEFEVTYQK